MDGQNLKKDFIKTIIKILFVVIAAVTVLVAWFTGAWFINNSNVQSEGTFVQADQVPLLAEDYQIYYWGYKDGKETLLRKTAADGIRMLSYDMVTSQNEHTPVIIQIPVKGAIFKKTETSEATESQSAAEEPTAFTVSLRAMDSAQIQDGTQIQNDTQSNTEEKSTPLSHVIEVRCAMVPAAEIAVTDTTDEKIWENAVAYFSKKSESAEIFLTKQTENGSTTDIWETSLTFPISIPEDMRTDRADELRYIYLEIDYNIDLIRTYVQDNKKQVLVGEENSSITFTSDLTGIELTLEGQADANGQ
jgi:hypothetical protein